jgi:hypothetical protein
MYDIIFIGEKNYQWQKLKDRFPSAKYASDFDKASKICFTKFFWAIWNDIDILDSFDFQYIPDAGSQKYIHIFKNKDYYDGVCLVPKKYNFNDKEIKHRFFVNKKEVDIQASTPKPYNVFEIDTYEEYLNAFETSSTEMFWMSSRNIKVDKNLIDSFYISHHNSIDRKQNHAFIHKVDDKDLYTGLFLCSKHALLSKQEVEHRFPVNRKEWDIIGSTPKPYDIVFISYQETNADENYADLCKRFPRAKRVHGVKGIHQAHIEAAKLCDTPFIWIVDGDAKVVDDFKFDYKVPDHQFDHVHVWRSQNPINDLVYGYGGVKLFPRQLTINMDTNTSDMTTSITDKFKSMTEISNITEFNTDSFSTWRSAFRECVKLSSKIIDRQKDNETEDRLKIWCTIGEDRPFGKFAIDGAIAGREYGYKNKDNKDAIALINDFDWLYEQFSRNTL